MAAMQTTRELPTPALLLDLDVLEGNLRRMAARCTELGVRLRPHVKTHKCIEIALGQRELGAAGITVSTLHEARVFAEAGFDDITWAFPLILSRIPEAVELADRVRLGVTVDSLEAVEALAATGAPFHVWLKVDCGYHRAGVSPDSSEAVDIPARIMESGTLEFAGLLSHSGNAYAGRSPGHIARIAHTERDVLNHLSVRLEERGIRVPDRSAGSTPSMAQVSDLTGVTEVRPGNYALYDFTQVALSSCTIGQCAATVLASVVSTRNDDRTSVVDAGALALSADPGPPNVAMATKGEILSDDVRDALRQNARILSLSQEHGKVSGTFPVGSRVRIIPNHSCLSVACFDAFFVVRGDEVLDRWGIQRSR